MNGTIRYRIRLLTPLHIGSGVPSHTADDTVVRGPDGTPEIPESKLKGAARAALLNAGVHDARLLAQAFGAPHGDGGTVLFTPGRPEPGLEAVVDEVTTVALTEVRTPRTGQLARVEVLQPLARSDGGLLPLWLTASVRRDPLGDRPDPDPVMGTVLCGLAMIHAIGRRKTRGWGQVRVALPREADRHTRIALGEIGGRSGDAA